MGMDLIPRKRGAEPVHYNWSGWRFIEEFAARHAGDAAVADFDGSNDGKRIKAAACRLVAKAIEEHADEYNEAFGGSPEPLGYGLAPAKEHARLWRESGGMKQF